MKTADEWIAWLKAGGDGVPDCTYGEPDDGWIDMRTEAMRDFIRMIQDDIRVVKVDETADSASPKETER